MPLLIKLIVSVLTFLFFIFLTWLLFQVVMYFAIFMSGAVGLTNLSESLKDFQYKTITRIGNVFRGKENKKTTDRGDLTKNKGKTV